MTKEDLIPGLEFLPLDYIRSINLETYRNALIQDYLSIGAQTNNLAFTDAVGPYEYAVIAEKLPWDSQFFGFGVAKLTAVVPLRERPAGPVDLSPTIKKLIMKAKGIGINYLFTQVDSRDLNLLRALGLNAFTLIESRVSYSRGLSQFDFKPRFDVRLARAADLAALQETAVHTVNPFDRFHADPFIKKEEADRLMREWVKSSLLSGFADATFVPQVSRPGAFVTVKYHEKSWEHWGLSASQPVLSAVSPEFKGAYVSLISEICHHLREKKVSRVFMTTQVTNRSVLRTYELLGFSFGKVEHIFRILL
jgi:hypothetical protein